MQEIVAAIRKIQENAKEIAAHDAHCHACAGPRLIRKRANDGADQLAGMEKCVPDFKRHG